ncbi:phage tail family protein [Kitasatospora sp. NPDC001175]|uniref:hypothetical protein n=1 Tax=Kitasatospora sp. NPDC001175 TaxID=3157103 RepID=UPI003D08A247
MPRPPVSWLGSQPGDLQYGTLLMGTGRPWYLAGDAQVTGWESMPALDSGTTHRAHQHGAYLGRLLSQTRIVSADLVVRAAPGGMDVVTRQLAAAMPVSDTEQPLILQVDDVPRLVWARVLRREMPITGTWRLGVGRASVQWEATDPRRYQITEQTAATGLPQPESGLQQWPADTGIRNLVYNPSVEVDLSNTSAYGSSLTRTRITTDAQSGTACLQQTATADTTAGTTWLMEPVTTAGVTVQVGAWVKTSSATAMRIVWRNGGTTITTAAAGTTTAGTWSRVSASYTLQPGDTVDRVGVYAIVTNGTTWLTDSVQAETGPTLHAYADGNSSGWWWDGVAHASTSRTIVPGTGLNWGSPEGLVWGTPGSTGDALAVNSGDAATPIVIDITGPVTTPSVTIGGRVLEYAVTLAAGETLEIDTWDGSVLLASGQSRASTATTRSAPEQSIRLSPGTTTISYRSLDGALTASTATVRYRSAYW